MSVTDKKPWEKYTPEIAESKDLKPWEKYVPIEEKKNLFENASPFGGTGLQDGFDFSRPTSKAPSVLTPQAQKEYIAEQEQKVKTNYRVPQTEETQQTPSTSPSPFPWTIPNQDIAAKDLYREDPTKALARERKRIAISKEQEKKQEEIEENIIKKQNADWEAKYGKSIMSNVGQTAAFQGSKLAKGMVGLLEGALYLQSKAQPFSAIPKEVTDIGVAGLRDKASFGFNKEFEGRNVVEKTIGTLVEMVPAIATAEFGGFFVSGVGNANAEVQQMKLDGVDFKNGADDAYILMNGVANQLLMKSLPVSKVLNKLPKTLRGTIVDKISLDAFEKVASSEGKITAKSLINPVAEGAKSFSDKALQGGINFIKSYAHTSKILGSLSLANSAAKKLSDKISDSDNFNQSAEDVISDLKNSLGEALPLTVLGSAVQGLANPGALIRKTPVYTGVLKSLLKDSSKENAQQIATDLKNRGASQGWSQDQIDNSLNTLRNVYKAVKTIPSDFKEAKFNEAVELITGRQELKDQLDEMIAYRSSLDESIKDMPSEYENFIQAKLDQSSDKLRELASEKKYIYLFDETTDKYTKQLGKDGKTEEINQERYDLEKLENEFKELAKKEVVAETVISETPEIAQKRVDRMAEIRSIIVNDDVTFFEKGFAPLLPEARTELLTELETLKSEQDAIQKQTAGQVPVLTEATVGEEVVQGKPKAEPKVAAEEGVQEEVGSGGEGDVKKLNVLGADIGFEKPQRKDYVEGEKGDLEYANANIEHNKKVDETIGGLTQEGTLIDNQGSEFLVTITGQGVRVINKMIDGTEGNDIYYKKGKRIGAETPFSKGFSFKPKLEIVVEDYSILEAINKPKIFTMNGEKGNLYTEEGGMVIFESKDKVTELGNIEEIGNKKISDLKLKEESGLNIEVDNDNSVTIDGNKLFNNYSDPMAAVNYDKEGNVISVNLETDNQQKRTIRGQRAEEIAYQYTLKNFEENATDTQIDQAIKQAGEVEPTKGNVSEVADTEKVTIIEPKVEKIEEPKLRVKAIPISKVVTEEVKPTRTVEEIEKDQRGLMAKYNDALKEAGIYELAMKNEADPAEVKKIRDRFKKDADKLKAEKESLTPEVEKGKEGVDAEAEKLLALLGAPKGEPKFRLSEGTEEPLTTDIEAIEKEMNDMPQVELNFVEPDVSQKGLKVNPVAESNSIVKIAKKIGNALLKPIQYFNGIPMIAGMSDMLAAGRIKDSEGNYIDVDGGLLFNVLGKNKGAAWAGVTKEGAKAQYDNAVKLYKSNKELFDRLWSEGKLPDGHIPMAIMRMADTAVNSNEAVFRWILPTIEKFSKQNKVNAMKAFIESTKEKLNTKTKATVESAKKILSFIEEKKIKSLDEFFKEIISDANNRAKGGTESLLALPSRSLIFDLIFAPKGIKKASKPTVKALLEGTDNSKNKRFTSDVIYNAIGEPSMLKSKQGEVVSIVGIDVKNGGVIPVEHGNYGFGTKGKTIALIENPTHGIDVFPEWRAKASRVFKISKPKDVTKEGTIPSLETVASQTGGQFFTDKAFRGAKVLVGLIDDLNLLIGKLRFSFPSVTVSTTQKEFDNIINSPEVRTQVSDGKVILGVTKDGKIYLNPEMSSLQTPIHEFGHVWTDFLRSDASGQKGTDLLDKGLELVKNTNAHKKAITKYGNTNIALEEALVELMANKGATIIDAAKRSQFKSWMNATFKYIQDKFTTFKDLDINKIAEMKLDDFINTGLADLFSGKEVSAKFIPERAESAFKARMSAVEDINEIIKIGRANNISEEAIAKVLKDKDFNEQEIMSALKEERKIPKEIVSEVEATSVKNEVTKAERESRNLEEVEVLARRSFPEVFEKGKQMVDSGEIDPRTLAESLSKTPRPLSAEESVALIYDRMRLSNEHKNVMSIIDKAKKDGNKDLEGESRFRLDQIEKNIEINDEAARRTGYEQGLGLAVRRLLIQKDYSLDQIIQRAKIANEGKDIPEDVRKRLEDYDSKLKDATAKMDEYEKRIATIKAENEIKQINKEAAIENKKAGRQTRKEDILSERKDLFAELTKIARRLRGTLNSGVNLEMGVIIAKIARNYAKEGVVKLEDVVDSIYENLKDQIDGLKKEDIVSAINNESAQRKQETNLKALKTRQKNREAELTNQLKTKDFTPKPRFKTEYDQEATENKARIEKLKSKIDAEVYSLKQKNRGTLEKSLDYINAYRRGALLSRVATLFKLGAAATTRVITTPLEETVGSLASITPGLRKIAQRAPREGAPISLRAEVRALTNTISKKALQDMAEVIMSGKGELDYAYGKKIQIQNGGFEGYMEFPGKLHGAIKVFPKRNEFFRSYEKRMANAIKNGLDPESPLVKDAITAEAYTDANRAIFMNDNLMTETYRNAISSLENTKDPNKKTRNKIAASIMKFLLPIVKVPTNFALETTNYAAGALRALPLIKEAATKGSESLTPEQADFVIRALKKQSVGLAFMALGYYNPNAIGGYYQQGDKRKKGEAQVGDVNVYGVHLPHFMLHAPILEVMQLGATLRRAKDKYERKNIGESGNVTGGLAAVSGLSKNIPFFDQPTRISEALESEKKADYYLGELGKSLLVPGLVQEAAEDLDKDTKAKLTENPIDYILAKPVKRKPDTFVETIKTGIPVLRQQVASEKDKLLEKNELRLRALNRWESLIDPLKNKEIETFIKNKKEELSGKVVEGQQELTQKRNELKKSLLGKYDNKTQMAAVDNDLYTKNFGPESKWVKEGYALQEGLEQGISEFEALIKIEDLNKKKKK